ncbi:MAG TPA: bacterioferritin [Phycisphaerae bacterium]|nr:bacterioferritin [Phycisphaerae bacterium]HOI53740.1 bacterioferritin [Phycisphaerae bacterium]
MSKKVIDLLNRARGQELMAIIQYMAQHYQLEDQDFGKLGSKVKAVAIEEMKHAEMLAERIRFLGGTPTAKPDGEVAKDQDIPAMYKTDVDLEKEAVRMYNESAIVCGEEGDHVSKKLFEELLADEEKHLDYFDNVQGHIEMMGNAFLANQTGD